MAKTHRVNEYLIGCPHLITVTVVGCGGTGSQVLTALARIHMALVKTGRQGLYVEAYDNDKVSEANIGRQAFFPGDLGYGKATVLISRINRSFGLQWKAFDKNFDLRADGSANIIITCVDNVYTRKKMEEDIDYAKRQWSGTDPMKFLYWMDLGNSKNTGQVILGTVILPLFDKKVESKRKLLRATEMYDYSTMKDTDSGPSCSTIEALEKQDLFINTFMANYAGTILWQLLYNHTIEYRGVFVNLSNLTTNPIPV